MGGISHAGSRHVPKPKAPKLINRQNLTVLTSHDVSGILNSKSQSDNGSIFKTTITQGVSKALGIEYHLHCSWRPQSSEKVGRLMTLLRGICVGNSETWDSWFNVFPVALTRAQTPPKKKDLSLWQTGFVHRYCHGSWRLKINYVTQLSTFQSPHQLRAFHGGFLHFKEKTFFNSSSSDDINQF